MHIPWRSGLGTAALLAALGGALVAGGTAQAASPAPATAGEDFTTCMRANGVPGFPAATVGADGVVRLATGTAHFDPFAESYRSALRTCATHLPAGATMPVDPAPPAAPSITAPTVPDCSGAWCPTRPAAPAAPAAPTLR